jgi:hypothetical protein
MHLIPERLQSTEQIKQVCVVNCGGGKGGGGESNGEGGKGGGGEEKMVDGEACVIAST